MKTLWVNLLHIIFMYTFFSHNIFYTINFVTINFKDDKNLLQKPHTKWMIFLHQVKNISTKMHHPPERSWRKGINKQTDSFQSVYILYEFGWFFKGRHVAMGSVQYTNSMGKTQQTQNTMTTSDGYRKDTPYLPLWLSLVSLTRH